jgi:TonB-dependent receptor
MGNLIGVVVAKLCVSFLLIGLNVGPLSANTALGFESYHSETSKNEVFDRQNDSAEMNNIEGRVFDAETGRSLPGANIQVQGTAIGTSTNLEGRFVIRDAPQGEVVLVVSFVGYETKEVSVNDPDIDLELYLTPSAATLEGVTITAFRRGQQRALNQQKQAANIINVVDSELISTFPDPNVGEALKRIPGINIQSDQGEARYIQIRGTSPTFSSISINGEQIAAPEGDERSAALDMIPSDLLASIEVAKAITPDMDGDAIGGAVNLNTMTAVTADRVFNLTTSGGYHDQVRDLSPFGRRATINYGQRLGDESQFGYMIGGHYSKNSLGSDSNEMEYDEGELEELQLRNYELTRERIGLTSNFDYRFNTNSRIFLTTSYNYFADLEFRRRVVIEPDEIARELKDRLEKQRIISSSLGGEHFLGNGFNIDYRLSYSYSDQNTPKDRSIAFVQEHEDIEGDGVDFIGFDRSNTNYPQFVLTSEAPATAGVYNYNAFEFDEFADADEKTSEQHFTTRLNLSKDYILSGQVTGIFKFGGLARFKSKELNLDERIYDYDGSATFADLLGNYEPDNYLFDKYSGGIGQFAGPRNMNDLFDNNRGDFELDEEDSIEASNEEDFTASEDTYAAYLMTNMQIGNLGLLYGVRYEHVVSEYTGNVIEFDDDEDLVLPITSLTDANKYNFLLPMVHLKYDIQNRANLRFAWTNTFAKPNYIDLVPFRIIERADEEIELGNPDLEPVRSMNLDLMAEYFIGNSGLISAGMFYKKIRDFIYIANFDFDQAPYAGYEATQPINGDDADLFGVEVALQHQLTFLPGFASGFGIYANYTYTWSEARLITEGGNLRTVTLPGQAADVANFAISYDKYGFSGRVSLNYSGDFIEEIRETNDDDRYYDERTQIDISLSQQISERIQVFADLVNITNQPLRYYNGISSRPEQQEFYSFRGNLGIKFKF